MDRTDHTERAGRGGQNSQIRRRSPVRAAGGKAPGKPFKLNYRLLLCMTAQVNTLTQDNQNMLASLTASLDDPTTAQTTSIADLIPQLTEGVYVVYNTGSQLQYLSVPSGYLQDRLAAYRDDSASYAAAEGDAPACTYYVLFSDRVIGLAQGNTGFVSMDRAATGSATSTPAGMYDFVAAMFA